MSYPTITAGKLLDAMLRARGFDPDYTTLTTKEKAQYADVANNALRAAWEDERWPQLMRCERRQFRPTWDVATTYAAGHQCYYDGVYYESELDGNVGNQPDTDDGTNWTALSVSEGDMIPFLPFAQPWADDNGLAVAAFDATGVDLEAFAYELDPLTKPDAAPVRGCRFWMNSVLLPANASTPARPYVRYRPVAPEITYTAWAAGTAYAAQELVYTADDGKCWEALRASTGAAPAASAEDWVEVGVPKMFADYIRLRARADLASDDEGKWKTLGLAEEELEKLRERHMAQTNARRGPMFTFRRGSRRDV